MQWIRDVVRQCREAGVPAFVKQLGSYPIDKRGSVHDSWPAGTRWEPDDSGEWINDLIRLRDRKGGDLEEWPEDLRVREFPGEQR